MDTSNYYALSPEHVFRPSEHYENNEGIARRGTILDQTFEDLANDPFLYIEDP